MTNSSASPQACGQVNIPAPGRPLRSSRIKALDGLRGVAALLVVAGHAAAFLLFESEKNAFTRTIQASGVLGVDLFFVVSGFLITGILVDGRGDVGALRVFWLRRALRILPLAVVYLGVLFLLARSPLAPVEYAHFEGWAFFLFFLGNIHIAVAGSTPSELAILWSLAIEEQFYLLWPFFVRRWSTRFTVVLSLLLVFGSPVLRHLTVASWTWEAAVVLTPGRLDGLAGGALLALVWRSSFWPRLQPLLGAQTPLAALLSVLILAEPWLGSPAPLLLRSWLTNLAWCGLVGGVLANPRQRLASFLESRPLVWVGERCYGTYVWHLLLARVTWSALRRAGFAPTPSVRLLAWLLVVALIVELSWRYLESPLIRLSRRITAPRSTLP